MCVLCTVLLKEMIVPIIILYVAFKNNAIHTFLLRTICFITFFKSEFLTLYLFVDNAIDVMLMNLSSSLQSRKIFYKD